MCKERSSWNGKGKIDRNKKNFIITLPCDKNVTHNNIDYNEFVKLFNKKEYNKLDFRNRKIQKYFVNFCINENNKIDNPTIKKKFYDLKNSSLNFSILDLSRILS